jgi:hypothetical protein
MHNIDRHCCAANFIIPLCFCTQKSKKKSYICNLGSDQIHFDHAIPRGCEHFYIGNDFFLEDLMLAVVVSLRNP